MEILFTKHALLRMIERAISQDEIYEVFEHPFLVFEKKETVIIGRTIHRRFLTLVFDMGKKRLLTAWPSNRSQRSLYQKKIGGNP